MPYHVVAAAKMLSGQRSHSDTEANDRPVSEMSARSLINKIRRSQGPSAQYCVVRPYLKPGRLKFVEGFIRENKVSERTRRRAKFVL
jgi:hypothetical protein